MQLNQDVQVNVQKDHALGITNIWINAPIRQGDQMLGVAGTGLQLNGVIKDLQLSREEGVSIMYVDYAGSIQLHQDQALINFMSLTKNSSQQIKFDTLFDQPADRHTLYEAMDQLKQGKQSIVTRFVSVNGHKYLVSLNWIPEVGWYQVTLLDLAILLPKNYFVGIALVYIITMLAALLLLNWVLNHLVLQPVNKLDHAMTQVANGLPVKLELNTNTASNNEIDRLVRHFAQMSTRVSQARSELEDKVKERTADLDRLVKLDPLTELLNRRGMNECITQALSRAQRDGSAIGILWLDVDWFKEVNDRYGHEAGDAALKTVAAMIRRHIRPYDHAARWGGDEFLVLLDSLDQTLLNQIGERIRAAVATQTELRDSQQHIIALSVSIGGYLFTANEDVAQLLNNADQALYRAKSQGRNCYSQFEHSLDEQPTSAQFN
ncbi:diguanylate cyclase [Chitinibacter sp. FCG-7]|uniref:Diguanylate cyclase n=1 Tax=Chitinibacter mangrovi TaxID=3153927 RepID=A0AAU7FB98_9NEIS